MSRETIVYFVKILAAGIAMVIGLLLLMPTQTQWLEWHTGHRALALLGLIASGAIIYLIVLIVSGIRPWKMKAGV